MGPEKSVAISYFHAFTGCDAVSFFARHGKRSAWQTWEEYPDATEVFQRLSSKPSDITDDDLAVLERCAVLLYDRTCELQTVNEARRYLFSKKSREMALLEHSKRAALQAGHIWLLNQKFLSQVNGDGKNSIRSGLSYGQNCRRLRNHVWNFYVAGARKLAEKTVNVTKEI